MSKSKTLKKKTTNKIITASLIAPMVITSLPFDAVNQAEAAGEIQIRTAQDVQNIRNNPGNCHMGSAK